MRQSTILVSLAEANKRGRTRYLRLSDIFVAEGGVRVFETTQEREVGRKEQAERCVSSVVEAIIYIAVS